MAVLVTGANGFIAKYIVNDLLNEGYDVIGVVRSQAKADHLVKQFGGNPRLVVEVVHDITVMDAFDFVFHRHAKDIEIILHCASPLPSEGNDYEKTHLVPAVNGTLSILEAAKKYGAHTVKHVVITSSVVAVMDPARREGGSYILDENHWCPIKKEDIHGDFHTAYMVSKTNAEHAAWEFLKKNRGEVRFELTTLLPVYVFGPQLFKEDAFGGLNYSNGQIQAVLCSKPGEEVNFGHNARFADVRDVAKAHLLAFQKEEAAGKRLVLSSSKYSMQDLANILSEKFPQLKGKIAKGPNPGKYDAKSVVGEHFRAEEILGIKYRGLEESVYETASQALEAGLRS
ncbi:hypothetical protein ZYGR_0AZ01860 [Zygosaccharomyces rouxii]|uniref:NAD-dependent epimerase/dehydratase domain-containing protein n=1 Tax=Zygosaccharomyces rouxii TaxID=4956 RepID=A0A1Q3AJY8_ZYGRO|nr:hypothetical protein ZYGR_0AZ01860 [Zygosaccharomyces rouxii]